MGQVVVQCAGAVDCWRGVLGRVSVLHVERPLG
jgi:hypothetical protein